MCYIQSLGGLKRHFTQGPEDRHLNKETGFIFLGKRYILAAPVAF